MEFTDVIDLLAYDEYLQLLEERMAYWQGLTIPSNAPDTTDMISSWDACGRVCSWVEDKAGVKVCHPMSN